MRGRGWVSKLIARSGAEDKWLTTRSPHVSAHVRGCNLLTLISFSALAYRTQDRDYMIHRQTQRIPRCVLREIEIFDHDDHPEQGNAWDTAYQRMGANEAIYSE